MPATTLDRLRKICLALPETHETENFGHQWFRVKDKPFCIFMGKPEAPLISIKVPKRDQSLFLEDERFLKTPYIGQHGWISFQVAKAKVNWEEMTELIQASYTLCTPQKVSSARRPKAPRS